MLLGSAFMHTSGGPVYGIWASAHAGVLTVFKK